MHRAAWMTALERGHQFFQSLRMRVAADTSLPLSPVSEAEPMVSITWLDHATKQE